MKKILRSLIVSFAIFSLMGMAGCDPNPLGGDDDDVDKNYGAQTNQIAITDINISNPNANKNSDIYLLIERIETSDSLESSNIAARSFGELNANNTTWTTKRLSNEVHDDIKISGEYFILLIIHHTSSNTSNTYITKNKILINNETAPISLNEFEEINK